MTAPDTPLKRHGNRNMKIDAGMLFPFIISDSSTFSWGKSGEQTGEKKGKKEYTGHMESDGKSK